jgi:hypothetical protein
VIETSLEPHKGEYLMSKYRTKLLITMQLCSIVLLTLFVGAPGSLEGSMAMLWLQAICSRAAARIKSHEQVHAGEPLLV